MNDERDSGTATDPPGSEVDTDDSAADADAQGGDNTDAPDAVHAYVLEYLPHGRAGDDRPQRRRQAVA
mgnify:FL=1